jgi:hypothetical protein
MAIDRMANRAWSVKFTVGLFYPLVARDDGLQVKQDLGKDPLLTADIRRIVENCQESVAGPGTRRSY